MKKSKKLIKTYVSESLSLGVPREDIREELVKWGLHRSDAEGIISSCSRKADPTGYILILVILSVIGLTIFLEPILTGFVTVSKTASYQDYIGQEFQHDDVYYWTPSEIGSLKSLRLDGEISRSASVQVALTLENISYMVFDSSSIDRGESGSEAAQVHNANETGGLIHYTLAYGDSENADADNNGIETDTGIIDVSLYDVTFEDELSSSNLCTRWKTTSLETSESTSICYGSQQCCELVGLGPVKDDWQSTFYLNYGKYGATERNTISSQIIYANYSLDPGNPYSEVYYSEWADIPAVFTRDVLQFWRECGETCALPGFNDSSYRLDVKVTNGTFKISNISYSISQNALNRVPDFSYIPDIELGRNSSALLDISPYAKDPDNDTLEFSYEISGDGIYVGMNESLAEISTAENFTGGYVLFMANDSEALAFSNYVRIKSVEKIESAEIIGETKIQGLAVIGNPVVWTRRISLNGTAPLRVNLTESATNITVYEIKEGVKEEIEAGALKVIDRGIEKGLSQYEEETKAEVLKERIGMLEMKKRGLISDAGSVRNINREIVQLGNEANALTGFSVGELQTSWLDAFFRWLGSSITGLFVAETSNTTELVIANPVGEVELAYETPPPESIETRISSSKKSILITSGTHYENILAYTSINELPRDKIALYWVKDTGREEVTGINYIDSNNNSFIDEIQWIVPSLSNQTYELELTILNVQSYPELGGNWTIAFNTTGTANLSITGIQGTTYGNFSPDDLQFLELRCGASVISPDFNGTSFMANNWSCDGQTGYHTVKTLTTGKHVQQFKFGDQTQNAYNLVDSCEYPADEMLINETTKLCTGAYNLTDAANDGLIKIQNNSVVLYCNSTIITGNAAGSGIVFTSSWDNVTIEGCTIKNVTNGINAANLVGITNISIINNTLINASIPIGSTQNLVIKKNWIGNFSIGGGPRCIDISAGADNLTITDNTITGCAQWGIVTWGTTSNLTIARNNFSSNIYGGIRLQSALNTFILNNNFSSEVAPIDLNPSANNTLVEGNTISFTTSGQPIAIQGGSYNNTIRNNRVINTTTTGIALSNSHNNTIEGNNVSECVYSCIGLQGGSLNNLVRTNTVWNSGQGGIQFEGKSNFTLVEYNTVINSTWGGVRVWTNSYNITIANNNFIDTDAAGIDISGGDAAGDTGTHNITIINNTIEYSQSHGISLVNAKNSLIKSNYIRNSTSSGIYLGANSNETRIESNRILNSSTYGIYTSAARNNTITLNNVSRCFYSCIEIADGSLDNVVSWSQTNNSLGISIQASSNFTQVEYNTVSGSSGAGILVGTNTYNATIVNNTIRSPASYGIQMLNGGENITIINNTIEYSTDRGITTSNMKNILIKSNYIRSGASIGIDISTGTNVTWLEFNTIANNTWGGIQFNGALNQTAVNNTLSGTTAGSGAIYVTNSENITLLNNTITNDSNDIISIATVSSRNVWIGYNTIRNSTGVGIAVNGNLTYVYQNFIASISGHGIYPNDGASNIKDNFIYNNTIRSIGGRGIFIYQAHNTTVTNNTVLNTSDAAIFIGTPSGNNTIFNNFINTSLTARVQDDSAAKNSWNRSRTLATNIIGGATVGGNFYVDYTGREDNNDSIGDTAYTIAGSASRQDFLPLANPTCIAPSDNLNLTASTTLCSGAYNITDTGVDGIITVGADNILITCSNTILNGNSTGYGMYISHNSNVTIEYCTVYNFSIGIYIDDHSTASNNTFRNNTLLNSSGHGITIKASNYNLVINNTAQYNREAGIVFTNASNNSAKFNKVSGNSYGIYVHNSFNTTVFQNFDYNSTKYGYLISQSNDSTVTANLAFNDTEIGFLVTNNSNFILLENNTQNNSGTGYSSQTAFNTTFAYNVAFNNSLNGILASSSKNTMVVNNTVIYSSGYGIQSVSSENTTLKNNTVEFANTGGVYLQNSNRDTVQYNKITNVTSSGMLISASNFTVFSGNTLWNTSGTAGIQSSNALNATISNNTITMSRGSGGATYLGGENITISNNTIFNTSVHGIVFFGKNIVVKYNLITNITHSGIGAIPANNSLIYGNTIEHAGGYGIAIEPNLTSQTLAIDNQIYNNTIRFTGFAGILLARSTNNTLVTNNTVFNISRMAINVTNGAGNNSIYNNIFNTSYSTVVWANSTAKNNWNRSKTPATNIIGGSNVGGNFYFDYNEVDANSDNIGDVAYTLSGSLGVFDYLPLATCFTPSDGANVSGVVNFCAGTYLLRDIDGTPGIINIAGDYTTINCNGAILIGNQTGTAIHDRSGRANITIESCNLINYSYGINISFSTNNLTIKNSNLTSIVNDSIYLAADSGIQIRDNSFGSNSVSIRLRGATHNATIINNTIYNSSSDAILLDAGSENILITNNSIMSASGNSIRLTSARNITILENFLANVSGGVFIINSNITFASYNQIANTSGAFNLNSTINITILNNTISNMVIASDNYGIYLNGVSNTTVKNNSLSYVSNAINFPAADSFDNLIESNYITNSSESGNTATIFIQGNSNRTIVRLNRIVNASVGIANALTSRGAPNVQILNNTIRGAISHGIVVSYAENNTVANNLVYLTRGYGIYTLDSNDTRISSNTVHNISTVGIFITRSSNTNAEYNYVNYTTDSSIYLEQFENNTIANNTLLFSFGSTSNGMLPIVNSKNTTVKNNSIGYSLSSPVPGIYVLKSSISAITSNTIYNTSGSGIYIDTTSNFSVVSFNSIENSTGGGGIRVSGSSLNSSIFNNTIRNSYTTTGGIMVDPAENVSIASNVIEFSVPPGIYVSNTNNAILTLNTVSNVSSNPGIRLSGTNFSTLSYNRVSNASGGRSIHATGALNITILNNTVADSYAATIDDSAIGAINAGGQNLTITNNTVERANKTGISLNGASSSRVENNIVRDTSNVGINLESSPFNIIDNNVVNKTSGGSIRIGGASDNNTITNNVVSYGSSGVDAATFDTYNITILNNTISYISGIGIRVFGAGMVISSNSIANTSGDGISLNSGTNFTIVSYNNLVNTTQGHVASLYTTGVLNITILNNTIINSHAGTSAIYIGSENVTLYNNTIINSSGIGMVLSGTNLIVSYNVVKNVTGTGIKAIPINNSFIFKNTIEYAGANGLVMDATGSGTTVIGIDNQLYNNTIRYIGLTGIMLVSTINNTLIANNTVLNTSYVAINISHPAGNNTVYNNLFNTSYRPLKWDGSSSVNHWNRSKTTTKNIIGGPSIGGNFYVDYTGTDNDGDGIGYEPYVIRVSDRSDFLPLTNVGSYCGDGRVDPGEECDDGNILRGDGCDEFCDDEGTGGGGEEPDLCADVNCDDGNSCTSDSCADGSCTHTQMNCDDGNACTTDSCSDGVCSSIQKTCEDECIGSARQYNGYCANGDCQYAEEPCGETEKLCAGNVTASCNNACSDGNCLACTPICPDKKKLGTKGDQEENSHPCVNVTSYLGKEVTIEEISSESELKVPPPYTIAIPPFSMSCSGEDVDITLNVPSRFENLSLMACKNNVCGPLVVNSVDELKCGLNYTKILTRDKNEYNPYEFTIDVPKTSYEEGMKLDKVRAGLNTLAFIGEKPPFLSMEKPTSPLAEPKNPTLKITGTPLIITASNESYVFNVTMPYLDDPKIVEDSISMYYYRDGKWDIVDSSIDTQNNRVNGLVDTSLYSGADNKTLLALIGSLCNNCLASTLAKVYEPKENSRNAVVFIHGLGVTSERFSQILNDIALTKQPWQAWIFEYDSTRQIGDVSKEFADLLEYHSGEYDNLYIVAHSLGGRISQEALDYSYRQNDGVQRYTYLPKVKRIIMVATPNKGVISSEVYKLFYNYATNNPLFESALNINSGVVKEILRGKDIPRVPGINYYVIAGTRPFNFLKGLVDLSVFGKNDGIVTVSSAQYVGGEYINDKCKNYWEIDESHTELLDNPASRIIIEKIIAGEIAEGFNKTLMGYNQYVEFSVKSCDPQMKFFVTGIEKEGPSDPLNCNCGNGKCDAGENEVNCPSDCAYIPSPPHVLLRILPALILAAIALFLFFAGIRRRKHKAEEFDWKSFRSNSDIKKLSSRISRLDSRLKKIDGELRKK